MANLYDLLIFISISHISLSQISKYPGDILSDILSVIRSYFKSVDKYRSESTGAIPKMRLRSGEDFQDNFTRGSAMRLSQFQPGRINRKLTSRFETGLDSGD